MLHLIRLSLSAYPGPYPSCRHGALVQQRILMQGCSFRTSRYKLAAGRVFVARDLGLVGAYTLECSLAGDGATGTHHTILDLLQLGTSLCKAVLDMVKADSGQLMRDMLAAGALAPAQNSSAAAASGTRTANSSATAAAAVKASVQTAAPAATAQGSRRDASWSGAGEQAAEIAAHDVDATQPSAAHAEL